MKYNEWPTLGDMIDSGKRVVAFLDYGANTTQVDFILPEFDMVRHPSRPSPARLERIQPKSWARIDLGNALRLYQCFSPVFRRSYLGPARHRGPQVHDQPFPQ